MQPWFRVSPPAQNRFRYASVHVPVPYWAWAYFLLPFSGWRAHTTQPAHSCLSLNIFPVGFLFCFKKKMSGKFKKIKSKIRFMPFVMKTHLLLH
jgi:hypothetical protein